jgi:hypothetical protein
MLPINVIALDRFHPGFQSSLDLLEPHAAFHATIFILTNSAVRETVWGGVSAGTLYECKLYGVLYRSREGCESARATQFLLPT